MWAWLMLDIVGSQFVGMVLGIARSQYVGVAYVRHCRISVCGRG